ncbi:hypothetical protein GXM_09673 [Nostoc sphaeroides CCNUC1]|uniref:Uncharacterized protein n=1 Tax=Nostoc sphaeroides CCNUC1 TaxID=2653204 RepID=A0A5P8WJZ4_9NOSO|nr:hypothetical protein GXM_09673 [Nostoc sphaeroides CCNUC1]
MINLSKLNKVVSKDIETVSQTGQLTDDSRHPLDPIGRI